MRNGRGEEGEREVRRMTKREIKDKEGRREGGMGG